MRVMGAQALLVGGSRGVTGWFDAKIEEGKVMVADLERGRSRGRGELVGWRRMGRMDGTSPLETRVRLFI